MLFSLTPKISRDELYDFDNVLHELIKSMEMNSITVIVGIRRSGKTSLLRVALSECGYPYIYMDLRFSRAPTYRDFVYILKNSLEDFLKRYGGVFKRVVDFLKNVRGISISFPSLSIEIGWKGSEKIELSELFVALDSLDRELGKPIVFAINEAQELARITWISFNRLFAYIYDNLRNLRIVLTGS